MGSLRFGYIVDILSPMRMRRILLSFEEEDLAMLDDKARSWGESRSAFIRRVALEEARRILGDAEFERLQRLYSEPAPSKRRPAARKRKAVRR